MSETVQLDPQIEELLREVAAEPRSSLLRVERSPRPVALFERSSLVGPGAPGLTSAERHLLSVYRHEVARLAKEACKWRLAHDPVSRTFLDRNMGPGLETPILEQSDLVAQARDLEGHALELHPPQAQLVLERCVHVTEGRPSVVSLAVAALRLEENDSLRISMGLGLAMAGAFTEAVDCWRRVLELGCSTTLRPYALVNLGFAWEKTSQLPSALRAFELGHQSVEGYSVAQLYAFLVATRLEDRRSMAKVSRLIAPHLQNSFAQQSILAAGRHCRRDGWVPSKAQLRLLHSPEIDPELSGMVLHALA